jgi:preprotein translocase subunit YajC
MDSLPMPHLLLRLIQDAPADGAAPPSSGMGSMLLWMGGLFLIFYFMMLRPQMREQKRRRAMLQQLKKNDRVITTGGMYGSIAAIDDNEVTLKIDDNNNVRVRFARSAIAGIADEAGKEAPVAAPQK